MEAGANSASIKGFLLSASVSVLVSGGKARCSFRNRYRLESLESGEKGQAVNFSLIFMASVFVEINNRKRKNKNKNHAGIDGVSEVLIQCNDEDKTQDQDPDSLDSHVSFNIF